MVYFTCNHCGESLKKASVEKHYYGPCRRPKFLTCVDCMKDFRGEEYNDHTKCITENEKYSAKGFTSRSPSVKGEVKQLSWLQLIEYVAENYKHISAEQSLLLKKLCTHSNVPQKRGKFQNFVKNISSRTRGAIVDQVWDLLEAEKCARKEKEPTKMINETSVHEKEKENGEHVKSKKANNPGEITSSDKDQNSTTTDNINLSSGGTELRCKKKKKKHDKGSPNHDVVDDELTSYLKSDELPNAKLSKSNKKRKGEKELAPCDDTSVLKKKKFDGENQQSVPEGVKTKKFNWCKVIVSVLESADNNKLSVKRLRKKVISEFSATGAEVDETVYAKFTKKLSKIPVVVVLKDKAILKIQN